MRQFNNILITGGCGFIGANFIRYILQKTEYKGNIINIDALTYAGNRENLLDIEEQFKNRYFFEKVKKFSLGMKQRLNIAQAIFENQKIILLDEPTNALDEDAVQLIYKIIREEKSRGATIIVATHHKEDLKEVCDVILKIAEGKIVEENENK